MNIDQFLRVVGWGPWPLPGERRRLNRAASIARSTLGIRPETAQEGNLESSQPEENGPTESSSSNLRNRHSEEESFQPGQRSIFRLKNGSSIDRQIGVIAGDILSVHDVDIWVNPENTDMEMDRYFGTSISSIIRYWGAEHDLNKTGISRVASDLIADELLAKAKNVRPVEPGAAFVTGAGRLYDKNGVRYIIHVASVHGDPGFGFRTVNIEDLGSCVGSALVEAEKLARGSQVRSILFPLLGTGEGKASLQPAVQKLTEAAIRYFERHPESQLKEIYFLGYKPEEERALISVLRSNSKVVFFERRTGSISSPKHDL